MNKILNKDSLDILDIKNKKDKEDKEEKKEKKDNKHNKNPMMSENDMQLMLDETTQDICILF